MGGRWIPILIFAFALACRLVDFNTTSITYDESVGKDSGPWWKLIQKGDFSSEEWGYGKPQAVIMRWFYGVLPEAIFGDNPSNPYDLKGARLVGAILSSVLVVGVYFLGRQFGSSSTGIIAALSFSLFPAILGHDRFASHDLPARMASLAAVYFMAKHLQTVQRRDWLWSALWAGISFAAYFRIGVQTMAILGLALVARWIADKKWRQPQSLLALAAYGGLALGTGFIVFTATWPYAWAHPIQAFCDVFVSPLAIAQGGGGSFEWFFGKIRSVPFYYYAVVYVCMTPALLLLAHFAGCIRSRGEVRHAKAPLLLWLMILVPIMMGAVSFRAALNHYLLICFPATCILAAIGLEACAKRLARFGGVVGFWLAGLSLLVVGTQAVTAVRIHPFYLDFFNSFVGGTRSVAARHLLMTGWYGEGIRPLFDYVNQHATDGSTVCCRLAAWPGLLDLSRNLRSDLALQGQTNTNPLGADYILRVGLESCDQFYRCQPDPEHYEKVMNVQALGGSIGEVWKRRSFPPSVGWVYVDDFCSPQATRFVAGTQNFQFNPFMDGKFYPVFPDRPGGVLFRIPATLLGSARIIEISTKLQAGGGEAWIGCGSSPTNRTVVARCNHFSGRLDSPKFPRPGQGDLWISLEMITAKGWDQHPKTFWNYDWFDSLYVRAWTK